MIRIKKVIELFQFFDKSNLNEIIKKIEEINRRISTI